MKYLSEDRYAKFDIRDCEHHDYSTITCQKQYAPGSWTNSDNYSEDLLVEYEDSFYLFKRVHDMVATRAHSTYIEIEEQNVEYINFGFSCDKIIKSDEKKGLIKEIL